MHRLVERVLHNTVSINPQFMVEYHGECIFLKFSYSLEHKMKLGTQITKINSFHCYTPD